MSSEYRLITFMGKDLVEHEPTGVSFEFDEDNPDYILYLEWLEEGNTPDTVPGDKYPPQPVDLEEDLEVYDS